MVNNYCKRDEKYTHRRSGPTGVYAPLQRRLNNMLLVFKCDIVGFQFGKEQNQQNIGYNECNTQILRNSEPV